MKLYSNLQTGTSKSPHGFVHSIDLTTATTEQLTEFFKTTYTAGYFQGGAIITTENYTGTVLKYGDVFPEGYRCLGNFHSAMAMMFDADKFPWYGTKEATLDAFVAELNGCFDGKIVGYILIPSKSNGILKPDETAIYGKYHVIFLLSMSITNSEQFTAFYTVLLAHFKTHGIVFDIKTKDASRFFFGTATGEHHVFHGETLDTALPQCFDADTVLSLVVKKESKKKTKLAGENVFTVTSQNLILPENIIIKPRTPVNIIKESPITDTLHRVFNKKKNLERRIKNITKELQDTLKLLGTPGLEYKLKNSLHKFLIKLDNLSPDYMVKSIKELVRNKNLLKKYQISNDTSVLDNVYSNIESSNRGGGGYCQYDIPISHSIIAKITISPFWSQILGYLSRNGVKTVRQIYEGMKGGNTKTTAKQSEIRTSVEAMHEAGILDYNPVTKEFSIKGGTKSKTEALIEASQAEIDSGEINRQENTSDPGNPSFSYNPNSIINRQREAGKRWNRICSPESRLCCFKYRVGETVKRLWWKKGRRFDAMVSYVKFLLACAKHLDLIPTFDLIFKPLDDYAANVKNDRETNRRERFADALKLADTDWIDDLRTELSAEISQSKFGLR